VSCYDGFIHVFACLGCSVSQDSNRTHVPRYINPKSILLDPNIMMTEDSVKTVETEDESTMNKITEPKGAKLFSAMLCCYTAFDFDDPVLLGRQRNDCICINQRACLDLSADSLGVGCLNGDKKDDNEYCKLGAYCCTCALAKPELRCDGIGQRFCVKSVQSFPFDKSKKFRCSLRLM